MKKIVLVIAIGMILLFIVAVVAIKYLDGLASGWGVSTPYDGSFAVHSYKELSADGTVEYLERFLPTRLEAWYGIEATVHFDTVTKDQTQMTVTVTGVRVPEDATQENFDPEWCRKIDDVFVPQKDQSWSLTQEQKKGIFYGIQDVITYITEDNVVIVDNLGKEQREEKGEAQPSAAPPLK